jgi:hypothetical protein
MMRLEFSREKMANHPMNHALVANAISGQLYLFYGGNQQENQYHANVPESHSKILYTHL